MMDPVFKDQMERNIEVYVDDILVKAVRAKDLMKDLEEPFSTLQRYELKLNPSKFIFGIRSEKFLNYMVTERGIEVKPKKF